MYCPCIALHQIHCNKGIISRMLEFVTTLLQMSLCVLGAYSVMVVIYLFYY